MATTHDAPTAAATPLRSLVERRRTAIRKLAAQHGGQRVRLFGSVARGQEHAGSDIDLLVDFAPGSSLFDLLHLSQELEALLGHRVDVVSRGGLKARDSAILDEAVEL
jgi:predicted nucleotidyltransferase